MTTGKVDWGYMVAGFKGPTGTFRFCSSDNAGPRNILSSRVPSGKVDRGKLNRHFRLNARVGRRDRKEVRPQ